MIIYYLPLEPYRARYTELLTQWTVTRFVSLGHDVRVVAGEALGKGEIETGQVLDAHGRAHWSLTQMAELVRHLQCMSTQDAAQAVIYFDDLFTPGYEALPYILDQLPPKMRPAVYVRNHAQSVDPDDFTFVMRRWMRHYEHLIYNTAAGVFCASTVHKELMEVAMLESDHVHVVGLPFDRDAVRALGPATLLAHEERPLRVCYASRLDREKQPHFFLQVVDAVQSKRPEIEFVICTGASALRSNDPSAVRALHEAERARKIRVERNLDKPTYYSVLASSRVQLNTARQDFISYTAIEASTFDTPTLAPAFRSFPETLHNWPEFLYVPWSVEEAAKKLLALIDHPADMNKVRALSLDQHETLVRIAWAMEASL